MDAHSWRSTLVVQYVHGPSARKGTTADHAKHGRRAESVFFTLSERGPVAQSLHLKYTAAVALRSRSTSTRVSCALTDLVFLWTAANYPNKEFRS